LPATEPTSCLDDDHPIPGGSQNAYVAVVDLRFNVHPSLSWNEHRRRRAIQERISLASNIHLIDMIRQLLEVQFRLDLQGTTEQQKMSEKCDRKKKKRRKFICQKGWLPEKASAHRR